MDSPNLQKCNKCGQVYPLSREYFGQTKQKSGRITFRQVCRSCMRANTARHYEKSPEKAIERASRRKIQEANAVGSYSGDDIAKIRSELGDCCFYCGVPLNGGGEIEHMTPISRGGTCWPSNLTLACFKCNKEKHGKTAQEYFDWRSQRRLDCRRVL
ncbi:HNH endonuclease [Chitinolyticbacter albus]|uniref:HNH endonuclease n=1 Tax=Chitinolyticbacter albus TaxID=2961951 RepID=UPI003570E475